MAERLKALAQAIRDVLGKAGGNRQPLIVLGLVGVLGYLLAEHPPVKSVATGEVGVRTNKLNGSREEFGEGSVLMLPGLYDMRLFSLRDQVYHPTDSIKADGPAPFQSVEGLSLGVDMSIRYALDPAQILGKAGKLPADVDTDVVEPEVQGVAYRVLARYTVREIFSTKRAEIQQVIETELRNHLADDGIKLRSVQIGDVDLPADYRTGMQAMLTQELETEKMKYTLELKEKEVKQRELEGDADKVQREMAAEAAGEEQIIAAKAQEEAMQHVLPFKQKQIEQRQLEAEADKVSRIKGAEANAQARVIEATGEADSRHKLADAEVYRLEQVGKVTSEQMARDGELISKHPLLIQKALADKLSDKISVIIAPPGVAGSFIGAGLVGNPGSTAALNATASNDSANQEQP